MRAGFDDVTDEITLVVGDVLREHLDEPVVADVEKVRCVGDLHSVDGTAGPVSVWCSCPDRAIGRHLPHRVGTLGHHRVPAERVPTTDPIVEITASVLVNGSSRTMLDWLEGRLELTRGQFVQHLTHIWTTTTQAVLSDPADLGVDKR
ncbi:hypothetical protein GYA93_16900 [Gordonia desulfuricans]|uniref:Uncharacterized protein n=1 Tax=Gordonia desulfuricans TaxID=89051 RepID=A0A7K3LT09_9ACTN|nr:hypothetical protein [Gordonia desulfuricans]NDK91246.1 hypothetical protein [Gordonia desulfuricans]